MFARARQRGVSFSAVSALILGFALLGCPLGASAQHHGGGHGGAAGTPGWLGRPDGVDEKDSLKDFHQMMAVQATSQQITDFQALVKSTEAAKGDLQAFLQDLRNGGGVPESPRRDALDHEIEKARSWNQRFQEGFSAEQKSGLKEITKRLAKADSDLEQEEKKLNQSLEVKSASADVAARADSLDKALTDFYNQELALGREMSVVLSDGQDVVFMLPQVKSRVNIANQTVEVPISGALSQTAVQGEKRTFRLELIADLTEVQHNITELLRAQLDSSETCGQRVEIRRATLVPAAPSGLMVVQLHFERWICSRVSGQQTTNELAESEGTVEIKLAATVENGALKLAAGFGRIDASGMLLDSLQSGPLGDDLREKAIQSVLAAAQAGSDFKVALPPAVQNSAAIQSAKFQNTGAGGLSVVLAGQVEISNEQADQLASQLNQALSARGTQAQGTQGPAAQ